MQEAQRLSLSGRYIEDCRLSLPSSEARDQVAASAVWQVCFLVKWEFLTGLFMPDRGRRYVKYCRPMQAKCGSHPEVPALLIHSSPG